jgi:hypothetical protein
MKKLALLLALSPVLLAAAPVSPVAIADDVKAANLRANIEKLVSFGTRHTLSDPSDAKRGIAAAQKWTEQEFRRYSKACGNCLEIVTVGDTVTRPRIPNPSRVQNVIAIQRGTTDPNRVVVLTGHIDSRVSDPMNAASDSPGANDDGSGTAAVIEAARILSKHKFPGTIIYAPLAGEEQGLVGAKILADYAKAQGWQVVANLNNDMIGNTEGQDGTRDSRHIRIFSEGIRADAANAEYLALVRRLSGENDSPSRNLSRWLDSFADTLPFGLDVRQIWRNDRFGRGGDHSEFLNVGFPAVRITEALENYNRQHQDLRTENGIAYGDVIEGIDFDYFERSTKFNVAALAALARAPMPPEPAVEGAVKPDTTLSWKPVPGAAAYLIRWRATDAANWQESIRVPAGATSHVLKGIRIDDWVFGMSSVSADGYESPVASAVPGGAFRPYTPPAK